LPASGGSYLKVHVQPGAKKKELSGAHGTALKVKVSAPAVGGKANDALLLLLQEELRLPRGVLSVVRGERSREKLLFVSGVGPDELATLLRDAGVEVGGAEGVE